MVKRSISLRRESKKLSMDLAKWTEDAFAEDLISANEKDEFQNCAARIAEIGGLFA